jgi:ATP-dependent helicase/nuclease subunit B
MSQGVRTLLGVDVITTPYGPPALEALARVVAAAKSGEPLAPVTVVVPSNHVGVTARRNLATGRFGPITARGTGIIGVTFLTVYRLAELLGAPRLAATGRRPVSTPVLAAALRRTLRDDPGVFGPVAEHPATEEALVAALTELADVSPAGLDRLAGQSRRAADVVRLCRRSRATLAGGWYDEADLMTAATAALADGSSTPASLGQVAVYLPQDLTRRAVDLLREVARVCPTTVIAGLVGPARADAGVLRSLDPLGARPPDRGGGVGERGVGERGTDAPPDEMFTVAPWPVSATSTRIITASDADDEVRSVVRVVLDAARDGTALERIAVLYSAERPYARLVHEQLTAAGVPSNGAAPQGLKARVLGRTLLGLLAWRDHGYRRRDLLGLLVNLPRRDGDGTRSAPIADWERLSRDAAVVAGRDQWDRRLAQLADELDRRADRLDQEAELDPATEAGAADAPPDTTAPAEAAHAADEAAAGAKAADAAGETGAAGEGAAAEGAAAEGAVESGEIRGLRRRAGRVRALRSLALDLIDRLEQAAAAPQTWRARVSWLRALAARLLGRPELRDQWPVDEQKAAERVERALDRLVALDEIEGPVPLDVLARTLEIELDADLGRVGRFGEGVLVAPLSFGVGLDLDLVVVVGMAEGVLPVRPTDDSLLPDAERQATGGELPLRQEHLDRQHRQLRAALAAARRHVLTAPRGDLRASNENVLSRWLAEITAEPGRADGGADSGAGAGPDGHTPVPIEVMPSFAHGVTHVPNPATEQEYRLRVPAALAADPIVVAGRELSSARQSARFTRFDGNLAGLPLRSPLDDVVSATRLETWAVCPHAYLMRQVLRVEPAEDPADTLWISPLERGSLIHEVLERFLQAVLAREPTDQPGPDDPWTEADHQLLAATVAQVCAEYEARGVVGRTLFWGRDRARIATRLDRLLDEDSTLRRANRSTPIAAEMAFGFPGAPVGAVDVPITGGDGHRVLHFRGAADRIDLAQDGTLRVVDYKTGRPDEYRLLSEANPDDRGTHLQLPVYGLAARTLRQSPDAPIAAEYWFVGENRGLVTIGYPVTDEVLARIGTTLATIVEGIEHGVFPARPTATASDPFVRCPYCDPDGLGVTDLRRAWERKRHDPAVAHYAELAEPAAAP